MRRDCKKERKKWDLKNHSTEVSRPDGVMLWREKLLDKLDTGKEKYEEAQEEKARGE